MPYILDYKEEVKRLISENYEPADFISKEFQHTTFDLMMHFKNILPDNAIDEHVVYEALLELGFQPQEEKPLVYYWYFKRKKRISMSETKKLNENELADFIYLHILTCLGSSKNINDEFKYDTVITLENLIESFSFDKFIEILNEKRPGKIEIIEHPGLGNHLRINFDKIE